MKLAFRHVQQQYFTGRGINPVGEIIETAEHNNSIGSADILRSRHNSAEIARKPTCEPLRCTNRINGVILDYCKNGDGSLSYPDPITYLKLSPL